MKNYTTKETIEGYINENIDDTFDTMLNIYMEAAEKFIDNYTGRNFKASDESGAEAEEKLYDGNGESELLIDDCLNVTKVEVDGKEIDSKDYKLYPANSDRKYKIRLTNGIFYRGNQNVAISGLWGYSVEVPADIQMAATILVVGMLNYGKANVEEGAVRSESIGAYSVTYGDSESGGDWQKFDQAKAILNSYKKLTG